MVYSRAMADQRVLIVEDDEGMRYAMDVAFKRASFETDVAATGSEAVRLLNENGAHYCAVILDMLLPSIHGSSVLTHIARVASHLPVIAVTGYPDRVLFADPADRHVVKAIFVKPVDPNDVAAYARSRCRERSA